MSKTSVIEGWLVLPDRVDFGQLSIRDGRIAAVTFDRTNFVNADTIVDPQHFVSPGFIDLQINGAFGKEFKTDIDAINVVTEGLPQFGTTSICPTITTRDLASYPSHLTELKQHSKGHKGCKVLGFHLEGPFLNPKKVGAQNATLLKAPSECDYKTYAISDVTMVTLSPELAGATEFISALIADGKKVGVGHSLIEYDALTEVFDPQNMLIVHVFNAMEPLQSRSPGVVGAALDRNDYYVSIIADGVHLDPAVVRIVWKCKQDRRRLIAITDGSAVTGMPPGVHSIGSRRIAKLDDRAVLDGTSTLVGSILTQNIAARNLCAFTDCSISDAVNTVSLNPATFLGIENQIGQIKAGNAADLVIHDSNFEVLSTYVDGQVVWSGK
jgi:N-acetylglucosamine-6-phosphate deacetylase